MAVLNKYQQSFKQEMSVRARKAMPAAISCRHRNVDVDWNK